MPTPTWERLPEAKRSAVMEAAYSEFAEHGFSGASINVICAKAGISKGSLFQYFTNKLDVLAYLAEQATLRIRTQMEEVSATLPWESDGPAAIEALVSTWVGYFYDHQRELALIAAVNLEHERGAMAAIRTAVNVHYLEVIEPLVDFLIATGQFVDDGDRDVVVASLLLLLPHIALAPHYEGLDPNLGVFGADREAAVAVGRRMVRHAVAPLVATR